MCYRFVPKIRSVPPPEPPAQRRNCDLRYSSQVSACWRGQAEEGTRTARTIPVFEVPPELQGPGDQTVTCRRIDRQGAATNRFAPPASGGDRPA